MNNQPIIDMTHIKEAAQLIEDAALRNDEVAILKFTRELNNYLVTGYESDVIESAWIIMVVGYFTKEIHYVTL